MGEVVRTYPSLDDQISACIEAAHTRDQRVTLQDFQLRIVANDLVLFNLKSGEGSVLYDFDDEPPEQPFVPGPSRLARARHEINLIARNAAAMAMLSTHRLIGWFAARHLTASHPRDDLTKVIRHLVWHRWPLP